MANPSPSTEHLSQHQFKPASPKGRLGKFVGLRFSQDVSALLEAMGSGKLDYIRQAVAEKLERDRLLPSTPTTAADGEGAKNSAGYNSATTVLQDSTPTPPKPAPKTLGSPEGQSSPALLRRRRGFSRYLVAVLPEKRLGHRGGINRPERSLYFQDRILDW